MNNRTILFSTGLNVPPKRIALSEFLKIAGFSEWLDVPRFHKVSVKEKGADPVIFDAQAFKNLLKDCNETTKKMYFCDTGKCGIAAIANEEIPKGSPLIYTGDVYSCEKANYKPSHDAYSTLLIDNDQPNFHPNTVQWVDAAKAGNAARFIQHAPHADSVSSIEFLHSKVKDKVLLANMVPMLLYVDDKPMFILISDKIIPKGQLVVADYGFKYWHSKQMMPYLYAHDNTLIDTKYYRMPAIGLSEEVMAKADNQYDKSKMTVDIEHILDKFLEVKNIENIYFWLLVLNGHSKQSYQNYSVLAFNCLTDKIKTGLTFFINPKVKAEVEELQSEAKCRLG